MLRLRRVQIRAYRDVAPTELRFGDGAVFLLGKNGTGKSTLLELLAKLAGVELASFKQERQPVDLEWDLEAFEFGATIPTGPITELLRCRFVSRVVLPTGGVGLSDRPARESANAEWSLALALVNDPTSRVSNPIATDAPSVHLDWTGTPPRLSPEPDIAPEAASPPPSILDPRFLERLGFWLQRMVRSDLHPLWRIHRFRAYAPGSLTPLDEAIDGFSRLVESARSDASGLTREPSAFRLDFVPHHLFPLSAEFSPETGRTLSASDAGSASTGLERLPGLLGAESVAVQAKMFEQRSSGERVWRGFDLRVTWPDGSVHTQHQLSFGQKRLFAFLWYFDVFRHTPKFTDELTNGLHADWVDAIVEMLEGHQAFHAVQNPLLIDATGPGEPEDIAGRFVLCGVELVDGRRRWVWRNPTEVEAKRLYASWDAGFQHLSEILRSEGLW